MAIPVNLDDLINRRVVESTRVEFKADWNPTPIIHSICAFANDIDNMGGGYIVIGVEEENGSPVFPLKGIEKERIDEILKKLVGLCHCIEPLYNPIAEPVYYQDVHLIVIWVPGGHGRPYKASKDVFNERSSKLYYIRKFSSTIVASPDEEKELFYVSTDIPFDDRPNLAAEVSDLDLGLMRQYLKEIGSRLYEPSVSMSAVEVAKNLQLISGPSENMKPLNVGLLMFCEEPERFFRYARIEVVDIPDPTGVNMIEKSFTGPIQRQLRDALAYIRNYSIKEMVIKHKNQAEAERVWNYPYAAVEEILANAVYHRSYQVNEPITVRITPSGMEITSFPGFDRSISQRDIDQQQIRARVYRNRRIGDFLKELRLIEGRNTGFPTAIKALRENGSGPLRFDMDENRTYLSVTIPVNERFLPGGRGAAREGAYQERILSALGEQAMSRNELARELGYKGVSARLTRAVEDMLARGALQNEIVDGRVKLRARGK